MIQNGHNYGFELACGILPFRTSCDSLLTLIGASGALAVFGGARAVRTKKFPMVVLAVASGATAAYYARWLYAFKSSN